MHEIEDYAVIGNCRTAALIHKTGAMRWLCLPHFDSEAIFASLLGESKNGEWQLCPVENHECSRSYVENTMVLETVFNNTSGEVILRDWISMDEPGVHIFRKLTCKRGQM